MSIEVGQRLYDQPIINRTDTHTRKTVAATVREIMREGRAMSLPELTLEVQRRGCRALDDSRVVAKSVRNALGQKKLFRRDERGRWWAV